MKAIIFDMDGVIADTDKTRFILIQKLLKTRGINIPHSKYKETIGRGTLDVLHNAAKAFLSEGEIKKVYREREREYLEHPERYVIAQPNAVSTIKKLQKQFSLAVASGSNHAAIENVVHYLKITKYFSVMVGKDEVEHSKPSPDVYLECLLKLGVDPKDAIVIEDSPIGIEAAKAAGIYTIAVTHTHEISELQKADAIIDDLKDITTTIQNLKD